MQAPHVTFLATYDISTGSPRSKTAKRNRIRENPHEKPKHREREQNPDATAAVYCVHAQVTATSSALLAARAAAQLAACCMAAVGAARCAAVCVADSCLNNWLPAQQAVE